MKNILVIGSLNLDTVIEAPKMPKAGETLSGTSVSQVPGGKGANQAYAAGKLLGTVKMIGAVGDDTPGQILVKNLESVGVDTSSISVIPGGTTGQAFITVDENGENSIIIIAGTNGEVTEELVQKHMTDIEKADIVIMQLEIPLTTVEYVKDLAVGLGKTVILDPAPAVPNLPDSFWKGIGCELCDVLTIAYLLDPTVAEQVDAYVDVETQGLCDGASVVYRTKYYPDKLQNCKVAVKADTKKFFEIFFGYLFPDYKDTVIQSM